MWDVDFLNANRSGTFSHALYHSGSNVTWIFINLVKACKYNMYRIFKIIILCNIPVKFSHSNWKTQIGRFYIIYKILYTGNSRIAVSSSSGTHLRIEDTIIWLPTLNRWYVPSVGRWSGCRSRRLTLWSSRCNNQLLLEHIIFQKCSNIYNINFIYLLL